MPEEITTTIWVTEDGTQFDDRKKACKHEADLYLYACLNEIEGLSSNTIADIVCLSNQNPGRFLIILEQYIAMRKGL